jgi:hypothetical protein
MTQLLPKDIVPSDLRNSKWLHYAGGKGIFVMIKGGVFTDTLRGFLFMDVRICKEHTGKTRDMIREQVCAILNGKCSEYTRQHTWTSVGTRSIAIDGVTILTFAAALDPDVVLRLRRTWLSCLNTGSAFLA